MIDVHVKYDQQQGLSIHVGVSLAVLRAIISIVLGLVSLPWLLQLAQALGMM